MEVLKKTTTKVEPKEEPKIEVKTYRVIDGDLNVRAKPEPRAAIIKVAKKGSTFQSNKEENGFIKYDDGWVMSKFVEEVK